MIECVSLTLLALQLFSAHLGGHNGGYSVRVINRIGPYEVRVDTEGMSTGLGNNERDIPGNIALN